MNKEFIPYQQALELKELGFDEPCFGEYRQWNGCTPWLQIYQDGEVATCPFTIECKAPTFSQAFRWFRERYGYDIHVRGTNFRASYVIGVPKEINMKAFDGYPLVISWDYITDETGVRKTYEEAELACLIELFKIVKHGKETDRS